MPRRPTRPLQQELKFRSWGGRRPGAGRPKSKGSGVSHLERSRLASRHPAHVTLKLVREVGNLRTKSKAKVIRRSLAKAIEAGFRIIDWNIQRDHIHIIVEAGGSEALSRGMQGLCIRIARGLNRQAGRKGKVFADRYHVHILQTPGEVRNARAYVLLNARRHGALRGHYYPAAWMDPYSSWAMFDGWKNCPTAQTRAARASQDERTTVEATTWLMRVGWRKHGLIRIDEVPGKCP